MPAPEGSAVISFYNRSVFRRPVDHEGLIADDQKARRDFGGSPARSRDAGIRGQLDRFRTIEYRPPQAQT